MLIYLATPYTAKNHVQQGQRFKKACHDAAFLMDRGYNVFSPIAHSHSVENESYWQEPKDADFWLTQDFAILEKSDVLVVDNWILGAEESNGIAREVQFAIEHNIPVYSMDDFLNDVGAYQE